MKRFLDSLTPEDVLAFIVVLGCLFMKYRGIGGTDNIMTAVISYRMGRHAANGRKRDEVGSMDIAGRSKARGSGGHGR